MAREGHGEFRTSARCIIYYNCATHGFDQLANYPQANAKATASFVSPDRTFETLKDAASVLQGDAGTVVTNPKPNMVAMILGRHLDGTASTVFDGVGHKIVDDLLHRLDDGEQCISRWFA